MYNLKRTNSKLHDYSSRCCSPFLFLKGPFFHMPAKHPTQPFI